MKIKIGIIGPKDSTKKICEVSEEFKEKIDIYPFIYERREEAVEILEKYQNQVDVILFSGPAPYNVAKYKNIIHKPATYIPRTGTSIVKVLFDIYRQNMDYSKLSIDSVDEAAVDEISKELDIKFKNLFVIPYEENTKYEEMTDYHYKLWKNGEINIVITGLTKTYEELKELGVPVRKILPTSFLIREYVNKAIYLANVKKIQATQIAIQIVKIKNENNNMSSEYQFMKIKNKFEKTLIDYTKGILGSIFPFGRDEYMIFSTRGAIDSNFSTSSFHKYMKIDSRKDIIFASGIGYGNTVYNAEFNARIALDYAIKKKYPCLYTVDEDGSIEGPVSDCEDNTITYDLSVRDKSIQEIADKISISPAYVSKIIAIMEKSAKDTFDAEELANYLEVSKRSARRILSSIVEADFGKVIAKESRSKTGRPRQIYQINI